MIFLFGLAPPSGSCRGGDLHGLYWAWSQAGELVVEDIPLGVWGLCIGKVGGVISYLGVSSDGATVSLDSASSIYAAVVCVAGG